jgi:opacity protein-like surface antigen
MKRHLVLATTLALAAAAAPAAAQIRIPPVRLIAGVGEAGASNYGLFQNESGLYHLMHGASTATQLGLEAPSGIRGVDLRLGFQYWKPMLRRETVSTAGDVGSAPQNVYRTSVKTLTLDAAVHLPRVLDSTPYLLAGAGVIRNDFKETYYHDSNQPVVPADRTLATLHLGAGTAWNVGRYDLFVEGSTFIAPHGDYFVEGYRMRSQGNTTFTAGIRVPIHH